MASNICMISVQDFIRNDVDGVLNLAKSIENLSVLTDAWQRNIDQNVLIDIREAEVTFTPAEIRALVEAVLHSKLGQSNSVAIVYRPRPAFDSVRFFEFLSVQEGIRVKVCEEFEEAIEWLSIRRPHPEP